MISNYLIIRDWESGSKNPHDTQPLELAACVIDPKSLSIVDDSLFSTLMKPEFDDKKAIEKGFNPLEDEALKVNGLTREELADAPSPKQAWKDYINFVKKFNKGKGVWNSPHVVGYNSNSFDDIIDYRMCELYGPKPGERKDVSIYHPCKFDVLPIIHCIFNNTKLNSQNKVSMDSLREYFGMDTGNSHTGLKDVLDTAFLLIKFLKLMRNLESGNLNIPLGTKVKYQDSFTNENIIIKSILSTAKSRNK